MIGGALLCALLAVLCLVQIQSLLADSGIANGLENVSRLAWQLAILVFLLCGVAGIIGFLGASRGARIVQAKHLGQCQDPTCEARISRLDHDLRTPLNAISGLFELIAMTESDGRQSKRAAMGIEACQSMQDVLVQHMQGTSTGSPHDNTFANPGHRRGQRKSHTTDENRDKDSS